MGPRALCKPAVRYINSIHHAAEIDLTPVRSARCRCTHLPTWIKV